MTDLVFAGNDFDALARVSLAVGVDDLRGLSGILIDGDTAVCSDGRIFAAAKLSFSTPKRVLLGQVDVLKKLWKPNYDSSTASYLRFSCKQIYSVTMDDSPEGDWTFHNKNERTIFRKRPDLEFPDYRKFFDQKVSILTEPWPISGKYQDLAAKIVCGPATLPTLKLGVAAVLRVGDGVFACLSRIVYGDGAVLSKTERDTLKAFKFNLSTSLEKVE